MAERTKSTGGFYQADVSPCTREADLHTKTGAAHVRVRRLHEIESEIG